jgi:thioredoxin 1
MRELDDTSFELELRRADRPLVVDFWAPWCRPCDRVTAMLEELEREQPGAEFVRVDADRSPVTAARHGVLALPTVLVFAAGEERARVAGAGTKADYVAALNAVR